MFLWSVFWIVAPNRMRREILRFSRVVDSVFTEGKQETCIYSVCSFVCTRNCEVERWEILLNSLLNYLNMSVRTCFNSPWVWTENRWSTQMWEILASGVETRNFVEPKLRDLSTVPCVIATLEFCSNFERSAAKSSISNSFSLFFILKRISTFWIKMRSCSYPIQYASFSRFLRSMICQSRLILITQVLVTIFPISCR